MVANYQEWELAQRISPASAEAFYAEMAWNTAIEAAAAICDEQAKEPECPERATYCAEAIRGMKA